MCIRNKSALWAVIVFVLVTIFVVSALAMARGAHRTLYDQAPTGAQTSLRLISREAKPSAAIGVVGPATKTVAKSKRVRHTTKNKESDR
jgi:hypothetical protein